MPTYISNYLFTGISHSTVLDASLETPITVNDSFVVGTPLYFGVSSIKYNQLRSTMGQSAIINFSLYTMTVFLCDSIDPSNDSFINVRKIKQFVLIVDNVDNFAAGSGSKSQQFAATSSIF